MTVEEAKGYPQKQKPSYFANGQSCGTLKNTREVANMVMQALGRSDSGSGHKENAVTRVFVDGNEVKAIATRDPAEAARQVREIYAAHRQDGQDALPDEGE